MAHLAPAPIQYRYLDTDSLTVHTGMGEGTTVTVKATGSPVSLVGHGIGWTARGLDLWVAAGV